MNFILSTLTVAAFFAVGKVQAEESLVDAAAQPNGGYWLPAGSQTNKVR